MKKQLTRLTLLASFAITAWSCDQSEPTPKGDYVSGVFVVNEGNFSQNNGAISFFRREQNTAEADLYAKVNGSAIPGGVQGYAVSGENGILLVDNTSAGMDKVEFLNSNTFERLTSIGAPDIENPREVVIAGNKAYVSCWGTNADYTYKTGYIAVIDIPSKKVTKKIDIASGPENLVFNNGKVFVGTYSFGGGSILSVIDINTDTVVKTIDLAGVPTPIGIDANGKLWVGAGLTAARIDPTSYAVEAKLPIGSDGTKSASNFSLSSDLRTIYFTLTYNYGMQGETYKFGIGDDVINVTTPFIKRVFSALAVDPMQGLIYAGVTPSYTQAGYALRYRADGSLVDSVKVNVAPMGFTFR